MVSRKIVKYFTLLHVFLSLPVCRDDERIDSPSFVSSLLFFIQRTQVFLRRGLTKNSFQHPVPSQNCSDSRRDPWGLFSIRNRHTATSLPLVPHPRHQLSLSDDAKILSTKNTGEKFLEFSKKDVLVIKTKRHCRNALFESKLDSCANNIFRKKIKQSLIT